MRGKGSSPNAIDGLKTLVELGHGRGVSKSGQGRGEETNIALPEETARSMLENNLNIITEYSEATTRTGPVISARAQTHLAPAGL